MFKVVNDPKSSVTAADRIDQSEITRVLFNMNEELAYTVYQIDQNIGLVSELMEKDKEYTKEGVKLNCLESL
jgi:predicted DNA-binding ArsR family transcriptional regulator